MPFISSYTRKSQRSLKRGGIGAYIETVKLWNSVVGDQLRDRGIPFGHPSKEFRDSHGERSSGREGSCSSVGFRILLNTETSVFEGYWVVLVERTTSGL
jgi:hypothetical protein